MTHETKLPVGVKIIIGFHLLSFIVWFFGQTMAVVAYDTVADWGLQDPRALLDPAIVEVNRAIGLADTLVMLPLLLLAALGLIRRRFHGLVFSWLVFGITLYWPVVYWCSQGLLASTDIQHAPTPWANILITATIWLFACWGIWYLYRNREMLK